MLYDCFHLSEMLFHINHLLLVCLGRHSMYFIGFITITYIYIYIYIYICILYPIVFHIFKYSLFVSAIHMFEYINCKGHVVDYLIPIPTGHISRELCF